MLLRNRQAMLALAAMLLFSGPATADEVQIVGAKAVRTGDSWRFDVTLQHNDSGWDHYADLWEILAPDGTVLGKRVLLHPHENEQPFTRSLGGVAIPDGIFQVRIRAHDTVHGWAQTQLPVHLGN